MPSAGFTMGGLIIDESSQTALDYCTLADVENYLGINFSDGIGPSDTQIATMISNASRVMDAYAGRQIAGQLSVTEYFDITEHDRHFVAGLRPVASLTNISTVNGAGTETLLVQGRTRNDSDYFLQDSEAGIIRFFRQINTTGLQGLKATYISGEIAPPADVKMATILFVSRSAARAALMDEDSLERVKEMWHRVLKSTDEELKFWLSKIQEKNPVAVATFGRKGAY